MHSLLFLPGASLVETSEYNGVFFVLNLLLDEDFAYSLACLSTDVRFDKEVRMDKLILQENVIY